MSAVGRLAVVALGVALVMGCSGSGDSDITDSDITDSDINDITDSHINAECDASDGAIVDTASDRFEGPSNPGQVVWALNGCAVRTDMVFDVPGDEHCSYSDVRLISIGRPLGRPVGSNWNDLYLWNPDGVVPLFTPGETIAISALPPTATDSGLRSPDHELWIEADRSAIYLVDDTTADVLPLDVTGTAADCA